MPNVHRDGCHCSRAQTCAIKVNCLDEVDVATLRPKPKPSDGKSL